MERRKQPKVKDTEAEKGSRLYASEEEITRRFENDEFFSEVIEGGNSPKSRGRRLAIIGEPGAGKTTLLQQIVDRVSKTYPEDFIIWVSLADLKGEDLERYLLDRWLKVALKDFEANPESKQTLVDIFKTQKVWLLLDGLDEMGINNPLFWICNQIGQGWLSEARIVLTCRLNVWDNGKNFLEDFDIYRNLDFDEEQVIEFIDKFFGDNTDRAASLREELNKSGKERIRDLIKNPLRLTLLCYAWQRREGALPETKAGLYEWFVETLYEWKSEHFSTTSSQRKELNRALGELAKEAIDRPGDRFRLSREQVVKHLGEIDRPLCKLALDIGWLNIVGVAEENPDEEVYAFFHASFQEYFAALIIDNYQFFLQHYPENLYESVYRVFEPQWKEVIALWFGRNNISLQLKNNFIYNLINFKDSFCEENFYGYKAYFLASFFIADFEECQFSDNIIKNLIEIAFGTVDDDNLHSNIIQFKHYGLWNTTDLPARKALLNSNNSKVIKYLVEQILNGSKNSLYLQCSGYLINTLLKISPRNFEANKIVDGFIDELNQYKNEVWDLNENPHWNWNINYINGLIECDEEFIEIWIENLKIVSQNKVAIRDKLTIIMNECLNKEIQFFLIKVLFGDEKSCHFKEILCDIIKNARSINLEINSILFFYSIDANNNYVNAVINDLLITGNAEPHIHLFMCVFARKLLDINSQNREAKDFLQSSIYKDYFLDSEEIHNKSIELLSFKNDLLIASLEFKGNENRYTNACKNIWYYAQTMTYLEFYKAWHDRTENPIPESLQQQDLTIILETLKTNNPDLRTINIKSLNRETDLDRLAKDFSNRIFLNQNLSIADIYDLENHIQTQTPNLTLILHGGEPTDSLLQFCEHLGEFARIAILTDRPIEPPLRGFPPTQANLENTLQEWLER